MKDKNVIELLRKLPAINENFNDIDFFITGAILLEDQLKEFLKQRDVRLSKPSFSDLIQASYNTDNLLINKNIKNTLHCFRYIRNDYAHNLHARNITRRKWIRFINKTESQLRINGSQLFPIGNLNNKRQVRLYFSYLSLWDYLNSLNSSNPENPAHEMLVAYFEKLKAHASNSAA